MKDPILFLSCILVVAKARPSLEIEEEWQLWKTEHGKSYDSQREELERHLVWLSNREYINAHNLNAHIYGFTLAMNHFGDRTDNELGLSNVIHTTKRGLEKEQVSMNKFLGSHRWSETDIPDSVDWREQRKVSSVKSEGQCGASYAFAAIGAIEGGLAMKTGELKNISAQSIVDCSVSFGNRGCEGGSVNAAFNYVIDSEGIATEESYPYIERQGACNFDENDIGASISGFVTLESGSESELAKAVAKSGPVAVNVDASDKAFIYYKSGVYSSTMCSLYNLNHSMLVVGYGTYNNMDYWIVKNSWNTNWGMDGYILMSRNRYNQCGIASSASYPVVQ